ncbi:MAG TPA: fructose-specific PTS transporter subunit EIIC [Marmoricola sp.]|nr:fructose-specific PTS transporter subunit EIIC [Marmoricola sp.]
MSELITPALVRLDAALGDDKEAVIRALADLVGDAGRTDTPGRLVEDALAREVTSATGLPGGIAIPHCRTTAVAQPTLAFARLAPAVAFGAKDGPADLAFLIAAPAGGDADHLKILAQLARSLAKADFKDALRSASSPEEVAELVNHAVAPAPVPAGVGAVAAAAPAAALPDAPAAAPAVPTASLVAVTACPTGIAHTYMAAEALEAAAARAGVELHVETQGSAGSRPLDPATIAAAGAAIFAVDVGVRDRQRFSGKPVVTSGVKRAIDDADAMVAEALRFAADPSRAPRVEGDAAEVSAVNRGGESWGYHVRRVLMTGVSYMIPFVAAGGLLIALGFLFGGYQIALSKADGKGIAQTIATSNTLFNLPSGSDLAFVGGHLSHGPLLSYIGALLFVLGGAAFSFLVPALAGYISYAIADRPGIAPGFVMGYIAASVLNSGFLGGIVGGVLAGFVARWLASLRTPPWARGLMPVLVIPLGATLVSGFVMIALLGKPLSALMSALNTGLTHMNGGSAVVLGAVLGLMMAFDMGGPLNKTAYGFATAGLATAATATGNAPQLEIMAAVMLAGMVPPIALALATVLRPGLFTPAERENGKAAWLLGASFITEGAIPFAAADPLRVVPSIMLGSAVTGALSEAFQVTLRAPHGGIFVLFAVGNIVGFLIALAAGVLVAAAAVITLKTAFPTDVEDLVPVA